MRRLALAAVTLLALGGASAVLSLPAGGSPPREPVAVPGAEQPPALESLEALGLLQMLSAERPLRRSEHRRHGPVTTDGCFREGPGGPCVRVCTQFVSARRCDRFPSPADGCLRFAAETPPCLNEERLPPYARQTLHDPFP